MSVRYIPDGGAVKASRTTKGPTGAPLPVSIVPPDGTQPTPEKKPARKTAAKPARKTAAKQEAVPDATESTGDTKKEVTK